MIKKSLKLLVLLLLVIFTMAGCKKGAGQNKEEEQETVFAVHTVKAVKGELKNYIELNGDVKAKVEVNIYPDVMGKLERLTVNIGDNVKKDTVLAYVDPSRPGMNYARSPVKSTISGTVTDLPVKVGSTVSMQTSIAKVGRLDELEIITYLAEKFISKLKIGLPVNINTEAYPDADIKGIVAEISPVVDPQTRMMEVKIKITKNKALLKPGMFAELQLITEEKENIVKIPTECVLNKQNSYFVFVVNRTGDVTGDVEQREIQLGIQINNKAEVTEGLSADEEIVYRGQSLLVDNSKIKVMQTRDPLPAKDEIE